MVAFSVDKRGISPVVGVVLLVAVVLMLASVAAYIFIGLTEEREPAPEVVLNSESVDDGVEYVLVHEQGERLEGEKVTLRGAADPDGFTGSPLSVGTEVQFYPVEETIRVVYTGEHDTTYTLTTIEVDRTVPEPDVGCEWVDDETNGGTGDAKITGEVIACDVETNKVIEINSGGTIIGETVSEAKTVDADDALIFGDVTAEDVVNIQDGTAMGSVTSGTADVKLDNTSVKGDIAAEKVIDLQNGSSLDGKIAGGSDKVKVHDSQVSGTIVTEGTVKLEGATVGGEIYVENDDITCSSSTIAGQDCGEYDPNDPDDY